MRVWSPELRYSIKELVDGLDLEMSQIRSSRRQTNHIAQEHPSDGISRPSENSVLVALKRIGLYKEPLGESKHNITCPWVNDHTGEAATSPAGVESTP
jgi:hypothetical protein